MTEKVWFLLAAIAAAVVLLSLLTPLTVSEKFYNIIPTEVIDPDYRYPFFADYVGPSLQPQQLPKLYERVSLADRSCRHVRLCDVIDWIASDDPRIIHECVLRFDSSVDVANPDHATRVLRLLMINLPTYSPDSAQKYLPVLARCFPRQTQT